MPGVPYSSRVRVVAQSKYLTARCPTGCESWLHPRAVESHLRPGKCRGQAWVDLQEDAALIPQPAATFFSAHLPAELLAPVVPSAREGRYPRRERLRYDVYQGVLVRSPIDGVRARRWLYVAKTAVERFGPETIDVALTRPGFEELEREVDADLTLVDCPDCGEAVARKCVGMHRRQSTFCCWSRARTEVATLWAAGWRDPFTVPDAPLTWTALHARVAWKRRIRTVEFPRWVAVLLAPSIA